MMQLELLANDDSGFDVLPTTGESQVVHTASAGCAGQSGTR